MEKVPEISDDLSAMSVKELDVIRWNAFLQRDSDSLLRLLQEIDSRETVDDLAVNLATGIYQDLDRLGDI